MSKFRVNSLSTVYHCAKHNLPTLIVFRVSISNAEMRESFGTVQPAGKLREKRDWCGASVKEPDI